MPWKDFTSTTLGQADVDTYLMNQAVVQCTNATRPASPPEGMVAAIQDRDRLEIANVSGNWVRGPAWATTGRTGGQGAFTTTSFLTGTINRVQMGAATYDSDTNQNLANDTYTLPVSGLWCAMFQVIYGASFTATTHFGRISVAGRSDYDFTGVGASAKVNGSIIMPLSSGEVIDFYVFQDSGSTQNVGSGSAWSIYLLGT